jgi:ferrochelatase
MGEEGKETFLHAGGEKFTLIPCLNVHPLWVSTLAQWVKENTKGSNEMLLEKLSPLTGKL